MAEETFNEILDAAVSDLTEHGYNSAERLAYWQRRLREAAERSTSSLADAQTVMRRAMEQVYTRLVDQGALIKRHKGIGKFTIEKFRPALRAELDRRILAAADLIRLNREQSVETTLRRFAGWSTSIPAGGSDNVDKRAVKSHIRKPLQSLPFAERRVAIDQGHKLRASIGDVLAVDAGAIAMIWRSHWREPGYNYRPDHKERDKGVYLFKSSWARDKAFVKPGPAGFYDDITKVAEEVFCRCYAEFVYNIRDLPDVMVTEKGRKALADARAQIAAMKAGANV